MKAKRIICIMLVLGMMLGCFSFGASASQGQFEDVSEKDWFYEAVEYVCGNGLMNGTGGGKFSPQASTTRAMIVTILHRIEGTPSAQGEEFSDVPAGQYYSEAVSWASANNIVGGYGNGKFGPNDNITREQMATIFYRYVLYKGYDSTIKGDCSKFEDGDKVSSYALDPMNWAIGVGLISGVSETRLDPSGTANRAQAATILMRFCKNLIPGGYLGQPKFISFYSDTKELFAGQGGKVSFYAEVNAALGESVKRIEVYCDGKCVCSLYDNGSDADDIAGDNVFSGVAHVSSKKEVQLVYTASAGGVESESIIITISDGFTTQELEPYNQAVDSIEAQVDDTLSADEQIDQVAAMAEEYMESGLVDYYIENDHGVYMVFDNGIGYVYMPEIDDCEGGSGRSESYEEVEELGYTFGSSEAVGGKSVLAIRPFLTEDGIGSSLTKGLSDFSDYGYSVQFMNDKSITIEKLRTILAGHDIIVWRGHGGNWVDSNTPASEGIILSLSETRTKTKDEKTYASDLSNGRVLWASGGRYVFNAEFINYYYNEGDFDGCLVYLGACHPMDKSALYNAFINNGASTVVGVVNSIKSGYNEKITGYFFEKLSELEPDGLKTLSVDKAMAAAKSKYGSDDGSGKGAGYHVIKGDGSYVIYDATKQFDNLSFEYGKEGWSSYGDFRVLTAAGTLTPTHGSYMALVGTGLGNGDSDSLVTSSFSGNLIVSSDQKLLIDFDFVSEEPMEWVGTGYNDTMQFILHIGGLQYVVYQNSINTANWKYLGGNYFYGGDETTYHTGWQTFSLDLSSIKAIGTNTLVVLEVKISDKGDSIFDSVVLVDNIRVS